MFPWTESRPFAFEWVRLVLLIFLLAVGFVWCGWSPGVAADATWQPLVKQLVADGLDQTYIESFFSDERLEFSPRIMAQKMNVLLGVKLSRAKAGSPKQPTAMGRYLNPILLAGAYAFYREHAKDFVRIEEKYGVPGEILTALLLVETKLGTQIGKHRAMTILASMALAQNFELIRAYIEPPELSDEMMAWLIKRTGQKARWGYRELKSLLIYAQKAGQDPLTIPSSMYGAIGLCQFIPSSALEYGVDGSGDGRVNLFVMEDALYSMANFVKRHGWKAGLTRDTQRKVIYRYNHSERYALTILAVADKIRKTSEFFGN